VTDEPGIRHPSPAAPTPAFPASTSCSLGMSTMRQSNPINNIYEAEQGVGRASSGARATAGPHKRARGKVKRGGKRVGEGAGVAWGLDYRCRKPV